MTNAQKILATQPLVASTRPLIAMIIMHALPTRAMFLLAAKIHQYYVMMTMNARKTTVILRKAALTHHIRQTIVMIAMLVPPILVMKVPGVSTKQLNAMIILSAPQTIAIVKQDVNTL
jgi:hypothetical protein